MKWAWAAYSKGAFKNLPDFADDLDTRDFEKMLLENFLPYEAVYTLTAPTARGADTPVGFVGAYMRTGIMEPHVQWYPWASLRNRLEAMVNFINEMRREVWMQFIVPQHDRLFFDIMTSEGYGILWRIGPIFDHPFLRGEPGMMYQSQKGRI